MIKPSVAFNLSITPVLICLIALIGLWGWSNCNDSKYWEGVSMALELKDADRARLHVHGNMLYIRQRVKNGPSSVMGVGKSTSGERIENIAVWTPPEASGVTVVIPKDPEQPIAIEYKKASFCAVPGIGVSYHSGKLRPAVDIKVFYWGRMGINTGVSSVGPKFTISRHIDDFLPRFKNLELDLGLQESWDSFFRTKEKTSGSKVYLGLRVNL